MQAGAESVYHVIPVLVHLVESDTYSHCIFFSDGELLIANITSSTGLLVSEPLAFCVRSLHSCLLQHLTSCTCLQLWSLRCNRANEEVRPFFAQSCGGYLWALDLLDLGCCSRGWCRGWCECQQSEQRSVQQRVHLWRHPFCMCTYVLALLLFKNGAGMSWSVVLPGKQSWRSKVCCFLGVRWNRTLVAGISIAILVLCWSS